MLGTALLHEPVTGTLDYYVTLGALIGMVAVLAIVVARGLHGGR